MRDAVHMSILMVMMVYQHATIWMGHEACIMCHIWGSEPEEMEEDDNENEFSSYLF